MVKNLKNYNKYEKEGKGIKTIKARDVWFKILDAQMETGTPYMLYKDVITQNQSKNLGTIKSSNLCTEIIEYSNDEETAVCNLASIALSKFIKKTGSPFTNTVTVYTKDDCKWCDLLKYLLKRKNIDYNQVVVEPSKFEDGEKQFNKKLYHFFYMEKKKLVGIMRHQIY